MIIGVWSKQKAKEWHALQPWLVGPNYVPAYASNQIEMWRAETFDIEAIRKELRWAQDLGFNTARVFLHDLAWAEDPAGFRERLNLFLEAAAACNIKPMLVLFDSVWNPDPVAGPQPEPTAGVHNAGWVQGPGRAALADPAQHDRLQAYVEDIVGSFARDARILAWDIWNEPDNMNHASYGAREPQDKPTLVDTLLKKAFAWARSAQPEQPLTSGLWMGDWSSWDKFNDVQRTQISNSDIITFHNYGNAADFTRAAGYMAAYDRPMICTEYMARTTGSTFEDILPVMKQLNIGGMNWGFVQGRTQTHLPWDSWAGACAKEPVLWFHEVLRRDGSPYCEKEVKFLKATLRDAVLSPDDKLVVYAPKKAPGRSTKP